jgi:hypothetical protein
MQRLFLALVTITLTGSPLLAASDGDRDATDQIAANLRNNGLLPGDQLGVKYRHGTVWLRGRVDQPGQLNRIMTLAKSTPGVPVTRVDTSGLASCAMMSVAMPAPVQPAAALSAAMAAPPGPTPVPPSDSVWRSAYSRQFTPAAGSFTSTNFGSPRN